MTTTAATRPPVRETPGRLGHTLAGTASLVRFMLRRDRVRLPVWILAITLASIASVASLPDLYTDAADRQARAALMANPGTRAVTGPGYGLDDYTIGAMTAQELLSWTAIFVALMSFLLFVRHTRAEEETGRAELVRSSVVGRHAHTTAALVVVGGANLVLGALLAIGLGSLGIETVTWGSSWLFGAALASVGLVFAAVAAVTTQVNEHSRGAAGLAGAAFAVAYLLRAAGDMAEVGGGVLSWLSPIGWAQQTRVYVDDRWWPLLLAVALAAVLVSAAYWLSARRDVGASLVPPRPGPATASPRLGSPLGLAWRLHRTGVLWWSIALLLFGLGYGSLAGEIETFVEELSTLQEWMAELGGETFIDSWLALVVMLYAVATAVFAVLVTLRARSEETAGRAEPVLATAASRTRWVASHLAVAVVGSAGLMALAGLGLGLTAGAALGEADMLTRVLGAALAYLPAIWLTAGLGAALFGLVPRASALVWLVIAYAGVMGWVAGLLGLPDWTLNLSPFGHVPLLPAEAMNWTPLVVLTAIAAGLVAIGVAGFRRRDLTTTA